MTSVYDLCVWLCLQHVSEDMYWHYVIELGFYWSLVFTLFTDHKRKVRTIYMVFT